VIVYLDASAIVKLVRREPQSLVLVDYLRAWPHRVTSVVAAVEVLRAVRRAGLRGAQERAQEVLARLDLVELLAPIRSRAATLEPAGLRTLDAIHLATVLELGPDVGGMITYDARQLDAARRAGVDASSPGA
jgi:predicted nucleic acid-binding protein